MPLESMREAEAIGALLLSRKRVTSEQLDAARREAAGKGGRLSTVLYAMGAVDLGSLVHALAEAHELEGIGPERMARLDPGVVKLVPARVCVRTLSIPVRLSEKGLDVAFADPWDESAVRDVAKAAPKPVNVVVTAEPLVYYAFRAHALSAKVPPHVEPIVEELLGGVLSSAPRRAPVASAPDEFHTTPMGGIAPSTPDEVSTANLLGGAGAADPETLLSTPEDAFAAASARVDASSAEDDRDARLAVIASALVSFASGRSAAAAALRRDGDSFVAIDASGALAGRRVTMPAATPTVITAALSGEAGYRGPVPAASAALPLFEGRRPGEILLLPLSRVRDAEAVFVAEGGETALDAAFVERLRALCSRARVALE